jgi:hypothetical protein
MRLGFWTMKKSSRSYGDQSGIVPPAVEIFHRPSLTLGNGLT